LTVGLAGRFEKFWSKLFCQELVGVSGINKDMCAALALFDNFCSIVEFP